MIFTEFLKTLPFYYFLKQGIKVQYKRKTKLNLEILVPNLF